MTTRRTVVMSLGLAALAGPLASFGQQKGKVWRVGVLSSLYPADAAPPQAFRRELRTLGWVEGQNLAIDWRYVPGREDRLPDLVAELLRLEPDVLVADVTLAVRAAMRATSTIPIVMLSADPVGDGLVSSLRRPGGNVTGVSNQIAELSVKRMQLLKEAVPKVSRVAVLWILDNPPHRGVLKELEAAASTLRIQPIAIAVKGRGDLGDALSQIAKSRADAILVNGTYTLSVRKRLIDFAARNRLPSMFPNRDYVAEGGLISYVQNFQEIFRRFAVYVDKILKGAKPGDLPVEQPTKLELVINMKTARALGIAIAPKVLLRADEVIE